jgi:acetyltransferase
MECVVMSVRNLDGIFRPTRIAVVGASDDQSKVGYQVLRNLITAGFGGVVYPVNAQREAVQGIQAYPSLQAVPRRPDLVVICTPGKTVPGLIDDCGRSGVPGVVILSAGFREVGPEGLALEQQVRDAWRRHPGMRIIGPNCLGVIAPQLGLNASFAADTPQAGSIALISQSGALCTSLLDWAVEQQIGFSYFVSIGNMIDVSFGDLIDYFAADPQTRSIILYVESISDARGFMSAARAFARNKPIVAYKAGRFAESAQAAASHTGALAGEDAVVDAVFHRAGIERVFSMNDMFDCAELLARHKTPSGGRLAVITNAGGPGVMATDALIARDGTLAELAPETIQSLNGFLPFAWSHSNPVDVLGDANPERFARGVEVVLADPNVDAAVVILTPQAMTDPTGTAHQTAAAIKKTTKPVLAAWIGGARVAEGIRVLNAAGVPTYSSPEHAIDAFMHLVSYARNLETLYETPRELPVSISLDKTALRTEFEKLRDKGHDVLSEIDSKTLLGMYGIPIVPTRLAANADDAVAAAESIGFPVVLKIYSPQITHKTDVGGVVLNLRSGEEVRQVFDRIVDAAKTARPDAHIDGVTVQPMIQRGDGVELIVGVKRDPTFGSVLLVGAGGITAELFRDRSLGLPPLNERLARRMLESLKSWPLLNGYRGRPKVNVDALIETLIRVSYLAADLPEVRELDINPLLVLPDRVVALDGRVVIDCGFEASSVWPYSHLIIRPYPEEYTRSVKLRSGPVVTLRAIRPEDEPAWTEMLRRCSPETLHSRFRSTFKIPTHTTAIRFCVNDYDREIAFVAEYDDAGVRKLAGVARLVADSDHDSAEFAVLVIDEWQNLGLGTVLTEHCLNIARQWGLKRIVAETTADNRRMVGIFERLGFRIDIDMLENSVAVDLTLTPATP